MALFDFVYVYKSQFYKHVQKKMAAIWIFRTYYENSQNLQKQEIRKFCKTLIASQSNNFRNRNFMLGIIATDIDIDIDWENFASPESSSDINIAMSKT